MWRIRSNIPLFRLFLQNYKKALNPPRPSVLHHYSTSSSSLEATSLSSRSLIRVRGQEKEQFLQGLLTNDITHLEEKDKPALFTLFLNHQGRVLFDTIVYKGKEEGTLYLECDHGYRSKLISHLKLFRLRKKVEIEPEEGLRIWVVYNPEATGKEKKGSSSPPEIDNSLWTVRDPRLPDLGWRIIQEKKAEGVPGVKTSSDEEGYKRLRYRLGVGEGVAEIPFGNAFPLEANGDLLNGVSFTKGCYLGQELTARTHHTGVVRKRLMPFSLNEPITKIYGEVQTLQIMNDANRPVGKLRGIFGNEGIALFRIEEALASSALTINGSKVKTWKPSWWPAELPSRT